MAALSAFIFFNPSTSTSHSHVKQKICCSLLLATLAASLLNSCVAGHVDRVEDRMDRREDRYDRRHYSGPGDRAEDYWDKRENVNDKLRGRRGIRY